MNEIEIGSIAIKLNRKDIKNLHISVLPPDGRVRVSAPTSMTETAVRMAVINRIPWIKKQQSDFAKQPRQSNREMVSGETHFLWGKSYRLDVVERAGRNQVTVKGKRLILYSGANASLENKTLALNEFYRGVLKARIAELLIFWQDVIGVQVTHWGVQRMKTKWGSCNTSARRILLNLELIKKPPECLEYILVHELVHLLERKHNDRFKDFMDSFIPDWKERRDLLNNMPLAHNRWVY